MNRPDVEKRNERYRWFSVGTLFFAAEISMARLARSHPPSDAAWLFILGLAVASVIALFVAVSMKTNQAKLVSVLTSTTTVVFAAIPKAYFFRHK